MIEVKPTRNLELVKEILGETIDIAGEDQADLTAFNAPDGTVLWLIMLTDTKARGVVQLRALTSSMAQAHVAFRKEFIGKTEENLAAGKAALEWIWKHTPLLKLVSGVPDFNKPALRFSQRLGFQREGVCKKSFLKNNKLVDCYYIGINKT